MLQQTQKCVICPSPGKYSQQKKLVKFNHTCVASLYVHNSIHEIARMNCSTKRWLVNCTICAGMENIFGETGSRRNLHRTSLTLLRRYLLLLRHRSNPHRHHLVLFHFSIAPQLVPHPLFLNGRYHMYEHTSKPLLPLTQ
jgi:hypothetical protein